MKTATNLEKATVIYASLLRAGRAADSASRGLPQTIGGIERNRDSYCRFAKAWEAYDRWNPRANPEIPEEILTVI